MRTPFQPPETHPTYGMIGANRWTVGRRGTRVALPPPSSYLPLVLAPPTYTFTLPIDSAAYLPPLEDTVPGAVVWLRVGRSWQPQRRVDPTVWPNILGIEVRCSVTCAWLADAWIKNMRIPVLSTREYGTECVPYFGLDHAWYRDYGRSLVDAAVERGELKPVAAEKATSYQLAGVGMMGTRPFGLFRWPPGCITGDAELVVNRGGCARRMLLKDLVFKFNGGVSRGHSWAENSATYVQSVDADGVRRLNRVVAAYASGVKEVYSLHTVDGRSIRATLDHRFSTPDGWKTLREIQEDGDIREVFIVEQDGRAPWQEEDKRERKAKLRYRDVTGMGNHPHHRFKTYPRKNRPNPANVATVDYHRLVAEARHNGMTVEAFIAQIRRGATTGLVFFDPAQIHVHHIDHDTKNNHPDNLEVKSALDHLREHGEETHWLHVQKKQRAVAITRIEYCGEEETFDLTMAAPMNNFVANSFVVHNSGKTFGALAAALSRPGPVLVICPSMARKEWRASGRGRSSVDKFTNLETHVVLPASRRPVHYESMADYVARMQAAGRRPVVVVGMEALADHQKEIQACLDYTIVVIDELHMLGDAKRWSVTALQDGSVQIEKAKTAGDSGKRNVAAMELLHSPRVTLRLGLTGTPLEDGRPRRLWAPGDLLMPGAFGRYSSFRQRYCGFHRNEAGYMDDGGASHIDELRQRWSFALYDVPRSVTHAELPPLRIDVGYLAPPDRVDVPEVERQNKPDAMLRELRALEKAAAGAEATASSLMRRREGRLAEAASRVRNACRLRAKEHLVGGPGKVMVLLTRHKMVEAWANYWRESFPGVQGWALHGDNTTEAERDRAIEAYAEHPGPCWLIGTGDSIGTSKDGMQCSDLGIVAQLPAQPGRFIQWIGRWDRLGGKGTTVFIPVAEGTEADKEIARLVRKFGPIDRFLEDEELRVLARKLSGLDREGILDEAITGMLTGSEGKEEWED
jgi:hypothetical protein